MNNSLCYFKVVLKSNTNEIIIAKQIKSSLPVRTYEGYVSLAHSYKWVYDDDSEREIPRHFWEFLNHAKVGFFYRSYTVIQAGDLKLNST